MDLSKLSNCPLQNEAAAEPLYGNGNNDIIEMELALLCQMTS